MVQEPEPVKEVDLHRALSNPTRVKILTLLLRGPKSVKEVAHEVSMTLAGAKYHLEVLKHAGLVSPRDTGGNRGKPKLLYSLAPGRETVMRMMEGWPQSSP